MAGYLTTHVLDTALGRPAAGMTIELFRIEDAGRSKLTTVTTNADGRTESPILPEGAFAPGVYELIFHAGGYLRETGQAADEPPFLDEIPIRFGMSEQDHYHVPLLLSPFAFSTYRGS